MKIDAKTPRVTLRMQGRDFEVYAPYVVGHPLTAAEANALNTLLGENLRNNFAAQIRAARKTAAVALGLIGEDAPVELTDDQLATVDAAIDWAELQAKLDAYAAEYEFGSGRRPAMTELEREHRNLATIAVNDFLRKQAVRRADLEDGKYEALIASAMENYPSLLDQAKKIVASRAKIGDIALSL